METVKQEIRIMCALLLNSYALRQTQGNKKHVAIKRMQKMHVKFYMGKNIRPCWKWFIVWYIVVDIEAA
jgi:hypothetical protein